MKEVKTLEDFYRTMRELRDVRERITAHYLKNGTAPKDDAAELSRFLALLQDLPQQDGAYVLEVDDGHRTLVDLAYETGELEKDIFFLTHTEEQFIAFLAGDVFDGGQLEYMRQLEAGKRFLSGWRIRNFLTDRDGTINNYCGRYRSSIQAVYNAVFVTRFAENRPDNSVILTSAPLSGGGLLDVNVSPDGVFHYAGSKGREYRSRTGREGRYPISEKEQEKLSALNQRLSELVSDPGYRIFSLIGSGLQFKFGQTTVARQDIHHSIPEDESRGMFETVKTIVREVDPDKRFFRIEDTGKDIEIMLTVSGGRDGGDGLTDFDKGNGIAFLNRELQLGMERGGTLICGDTRSDLPMVETAVKNSSDTRAVFVTEDEELKAELAGIGGNTFTVSTPDILVTILDSEGVNI